MSVLGFIGICVASVEKKSKNSSDWIELITFQSLLLDTPKLTDIIVHSFNHMFQSRQLLALLQNGKMWLVNAKCFQISCKIDLCEYFLFHRCVVGCVMGPGLKPKQNCTLLAKYISDNQAEESFVIAYLKNTEVLLLIHSSDC